MVLPKFDKDHFSLFTSAGEGWCSSPERSVSVLNVLLRLSTFSCWYLNQVYNWIFDACRRWCVQPVNGDVALSTSIVTVLNKLSIHFA